MTTLALTMGDPAGIGPEITAKALNALSGWLGEHNTKVRFFGDPSLLPNQVLDLPCVELVPISLDATVQTGQGDRANGQATIDSILKAVRACRDGLADAVITNPINKAVLYDAGFAHPGHTEFLALLCDAPKPSVMMLASPHLRVVPITLHLSLYDAIAQIRTQGHELTCHCIETTARALQGQGIAHPRLAVSGLNPHAGEQGTMGREESEIIAPAIASFAQERSFTVTGPWPADTMFDAHNRKRFDAALAMTHDQALIPIKTLAFDSAVNVTLGLPIIRTSPDHGTAFDIAGKGVARPDSLIAAIKMAASMTRRQT